MGEIRANASPIVADVIDSQPLGRYQYAIIGLVALAVLFDGFDQQVIGFAIPTLIVQWKVSHGAFAAVISAGLFGMTIGTLIAGVAGDRYGRRFTIIISLLIFGLGTIVAAGSKFIGQIELMRFVSGLGIGGALPNAAAYAAEYSPLRRRAQMVTATIVCVPLGGMIGGLLAAAILPHGGWRVLFAVAGILPTLLALLLFVAVPETLQYLTMRGDHQAAIQRILRRMGRGPGDTPMPSAPPAAARSGAKVSKLFDGLGQLDTPALWLLFFCALISVNLVFSWLPAMLAGIGYGVRAASYGLSAFNFGGVGGAIAGAWLIGRLGSRKALAALAFVGIAAGAVLAYVAAGGSQAAVIAVIAAFGFAINGVQTNAFTLAAHIYPAPIRATGVGAALGLGRIGAVLASFLGAAVLGYARGILYFPFITAMLILSLPALMLIKRHIPPHRQMRAQQKS